MLRDRPEWQGRIHPAAVVYSARAGGKYAACDGAVLDPLLPLTQVQTMEQAVSQTEAPRRFNTMLIGVSRLRRCCWRCWGSISVISFSVASRVQEMAIRMALGSRRGSIARLVLKSGAKLAVVGA